MNDFMDWLWEFRGIIIWFCVLALLIILGITVSHVFFLIMAIYVFFTLLIAMENNN